MGDHTPEPLRVITWHLTYPNKETRIVSDNGHVATMNDGVDAEANAKRIVLTWNCHVGLLEACREALSTINGINDDKRRQGRYDTYDACPIALEAAIAKANES